MVGGRNGVGEFDGKSLRGFFLGVVEDEAKLASDKKLRTFLEGERKKKKIRFSCGGRHLLYR